MLSTISKPPSAAAKQTLTRSALPPSPLPSGPTRCRCKPPVPKGKPSLLNQAASPDALFAAPQAIPATLAPYSHPVKSDPSRATSNSPSIWRNIDFAMRSKASACSPARPPASSKTRYRSYRPFHSGLAFHLILLLWPRQALFTTRISAVHTHSVPGAMTITSAHLTPLISVT